MEKVSIILPVYNVEKYIRTCLDSVLKQSYQNIEIILVDDGSTDQSGIICDEYGHIDKRIKVFHQKNAGVSTARNVGIDAATGEYVCFADSDDILTPDYVSYLLSILQENDADIAVTTSFFTSFGGQQSKRDNINVVSGEDAAIAILYYHIPIGCYCKMFRLDFLRTNHIRFIPSVYIGEGFNFNVNAFIQASKVVIGHKKIYCYRRDNTESAMTRFKIEKSEMALKAIDIIRETLNTKSERLNQACDFAKWHTSGDMYNWMALAGVKQTYPTMYSKCYQAIKLYSCKAVQSPINRKEKIRAILQWIHPQLLVYVLKLRRLVFTLQNKVS